ncbi:PGF-pre-PGF domain-containing protein [Candidatus Woesearchaeota archaeon]|nr:PGF-pre-PGF domain-containing protein [Candidatus Woesearchaeota archaeon]
MSMAKLMLRRLVTVLLLSAFIAAMSAAQDATPPSIEMNVSLPLNVTSNLTVLLSANFSDSEGFVGNLSLYNFSDGSKAKNRTFSSGERHIVYLLIPNGARAISSVFAMKGSRENFTNPELDTPIGTSGQGIRPERCRTISPPTNFDSVEIKAQVEFNGSPSDDESRGSSGLIAQLRGPSHQGYQVIEGKSCKLTEPSTTWSWESCKIKYDGQRSFAAETIYACISSNASTYASYGVNTQFGTGESAPIAPISSASGLETVAGATYAIVPKFEASFTSLPENVSVAIGSTSVFTTSGVLNETQNTQDLSAALNEYLGGCNFTSEGCIIPINLSVAKGGIVELSGINVTYSLNRLCYLCLAADVICDSEWVNVTTVYADNLHGNCTHHWNVSAYVDSEYNVSFRIKDLASNIGILSRSVTLDRTAPQLQYLSLNVRTIDGSPVLVVNNTNSANTSTDILFSFYIYDMSDLGSCSVLINGRVNKTNSYLKNDRRWQEFRVNISTNVSELRHYNWSLRCSDTFGNERETETKKLAVLVLGGFSGESTDLSTANLSKIGNLTFEDVKWGKIKFSRDVNLSGISGVLNIADYVKIFNNSIEINSTALPALNTTATLTLHNLTYASPRIVRDGVVCPPTICQVINYSNGTLTFNVTQFSVYSAEEAPPSAGDAPSGGSGGGSGGGGGGGGGGVASLASETSLLQAELRAGDSGTFAFKKFNDLAVYEIVAEAAAAAVNPSVTVREAKLSNSPLPIAGESGKVHKYLSITKSSLENISGVAVKFKVNNTWLEGNSIDSATVKLSRLEKGSWNALPTTLIGEDGEFTSYQAVTPGFSIFAITGNFKASPPFNREVSDEVKAEEKAGGEVLLTEGETSSEALGINIPSDEPFSAVTGRAVSGAGSGQARSKPIILAFVVLLALAVFLVGKAKFKPQQQNEKA